MCDLVYGFYSRYDVNNCIDDESVLSFELCPKNVHGLDYDIYLCENGTWKGNEHETPRIKINETIELSISSVPEILTNTTTKTMEDISDVVDFVISNEKELLYFWDFDNSITPKPDTFLYKLVNRFTI